MKISDIIAEAHVRTAKNRRMVLGMAQRLQRIIAPIANQILLYRLFDTEEPQGAITYVSSHGRDVNKIKSQKTTQSLQNQVFEQFQIQNPVFATTNPARRTRMFAWGQSNILVPPAKSRIFSNPYIADIGSAQLINGNYAQSAEEITQVLPQYQQGWPTKPSNAEVIVDTPGYYLINLEYLVPETDPMYHQDYQDPVMFSYDSGPAPNLEVWQQNLRTYGDILKYYQQLTRQK